MARRRADTAKASERALDIGAMVTASRLAQGLAPKVKDPDVIETVATIIRSTTRKGEPTNGNR